MIEPSAIGFDTEIEVGGFKSCGSVIRQDDNPVFVCQFLKLNIHPLAPVFKGSCGNTVVQGRDIRIALVSVTSKMHGKLVHYRHSRSQLRELELIGCVAQDTVPAKRDKKIGSCFETGKMHCIIFSEAFRRNGVSIQKNLVIIKDI